MLREGQDLIARGIVTYVKATPAPALAAWG